MAWDYDPKAEVEESGRRYPGGRYWFRIEQAQEKTYKSGNRGMSLILSVAVTPNQNITVHENIIYVDQCRFKLKQICEGTGLDYANPPRGGFEEHHFEGKTGWGHFSPQGDKGYLGLDKVEPASANNGPDSRSGDEDAPF